jgi:hypothetical protein
MSRGAERQDDKEEPNNPGQVALKSHVIRILAALQTDV